MLYDAACYVCDCRNSQRNTCTASSPRLLCSYGSVDVNCKVLHGGGGGEGNKAGHVELTMFN